MDKFGLFEFLSKLSANKEAQNSLNTVISNLFGGFNGNANNGNNASGKTQNDDATQTTNAKDKNASTIKNATTVNLNDTVYSSPLNLTLYNDLIKRHDDISKTIITNGKSGKNS